jgi:hypothetical protein
VECDKIKLGDHTQYGVECDKIKLGYHTNGTMLLQIDTINSLQVDKVGSSIYYNLSYRNNC